MMPGHNGRELGVFSSFISSVVLLILYVFGGGARRLISRESNPANS